MAIFSRVSSDNVSGQERLDHTAHGGAQVDLDLHCMHMPQRRLFAWRGCDPVSILYKSIAGRYRPISVADGPITARYRFIKNASWVRPSKK